MREQESPGTSAEVSWTVDGTTVDGTLVVPAGTGPFPAVVLVAGSGPTDRDWNTPLLPGTNGSARLLAGALAGAGSASLRYDKRAAGPRARENMQSLIGTVSMQVKATTGVIQNIQDAVSGTTICLRKSFRRSR